MPYHGLSNKTTRSRLRHVPVYIASSKAYKEASTFLQSSEKHLPRLLIRILNSTLFAKKMKVRLVLLALDDHGQLTRLYSSLHSVASLLLRSSVSRLLPLPMRTPGTKILNPARLARLPRTTIPTPAHPMEPRHTRLTLLQAYELITHGL